MFAIKKMRESAGLSQQDVADALGVKKPRYGDWERETTQINLRDAIRLADLFGCTLDELANHHVESAFPSLSPEERRLLDAYKTANAQGRAAIDAVAGASSGVGQERPPGVASGGVSA